MDGVNGLGNRVTPARLSQPCEEEGDNSAAERGKRRDRGDRHFIETTHRRLETNVKTKEEGREGGGGEWNLCLHAYEHGSFQPAKSQTRLLKDKNAGTRSNDSLAQYTAASASRTLPVAPHVDKTSASTTTLQLKQATTLASSSSAHITGKPRIRHRCRSYFQIKHQKH